jgi:uncharacterized membrane protein
MAETIVENQVCSACGADVREGALFCYHCGGAVASEITVAKNDNNKKVSKIPSRRKNSKENENGNQPKQNEINQKPAIRETIVEEAIAKPVEKPTIQNEVKLQSAAAMREKSKIAQPKRIEVIWEEHENTPNVWFVLAAVALTVLVVVILFLAVRMR